MSIIKVVKDSRQKFLISDAEIHNNKNISWGARGLHAYLMSKPPNWEVNRDDLVEAAAAGRDQVQRLINELKEHGYMNRGQRQDQGTGKFVTYTDIYERLDLNPEYTPIYGGSSGEQEPRTGNQAPVSRAGSTEDGKPVHIVSNNKKRYKGDFSDFETGELSGEVPEVQVLMVQALLSVCKGYANMLVPPDCRFHQGAVILIENDVSIPQVTAFGPWWEENGYYNGKPTVKSLMDEIKNSVNGVKTGRMKKSPESIKAVSELEMWMNRKIGISEFSSPRTLLAIQAVGETVIRGMTINNRKNVLASFTREFEKAKRDGETV